MGQTREVLPAAIAEGLLLFRCVDAGEADLVLALVRGEQRQRVALGDFDDLPDEFLSMSGTRKYEQQAYRHFSPFWDAPEGWDCRTCAHSVRQIDGHHLFCQRARIVLVDLCGRWERPAGEDERIGVEGTAHYLDRNRQPKLLGPCFEGLPRTRAAVLRFAFSG